jgi:DNA-binding response OmpR family regulator
VGLLWHNIKMNTTKKILIIEDDATLSELLSKQLLSSGFETLVASNGLEGLVKIKNDKPDAIIVDIMLPVMDGVKMLEELRRTDPHIKIPIIVLTNLNDIEHIEKAINNNAIAYLVKSDQSLQNILDILHKKLGM